MQTIVFMMLAVVLAPPAAGPTPPADSTPPAAARSAGQKPDEVPTIDMGKSGEYTSGKWQYRLTVTAAGTPREGRLGRLLYGGKEVPRRPGDWYDTPWGPMTWLYLRASLRGSSGWIPLPPGARPRGKRLAPPGMEAEKPQELTEADDGKTVKLEMGKALVIRLKGNPTTGYSWRIAGITEKVVEAVGEPAYEEQPHRPGMVGVGGTFLFWLKTVKPGKATVKLEYARPWEKDKPPEKTFSVTVEVLAKR